MIRRRLAVVESGQELRGAGPPAFEKLARTASPGSDTHHGLVMICATLTGRSLAACVPPSAQAELLAGVTVAIDWARGSASENEAKAVRASCFQAVTAIEEMTAKAVIGAQAHLGQAKDTPLDAHADHVVERYARLAAHFTVSAVCHTLDAISEPAQALEVPGDVEGARAYQATGLGSARHPAFRKAAWGQAQWEAARASESNPGSLAVQVFHEYLGGRWRLHADAERLNIEDFLNWALSARAARA